MNTSLEAEGLAVEPPVLQPAANEEFAAVARPSSGWDPYEVWRTRIKVVQEALTPRVALS